MFKANHSKGGILPLTLLLLTRVRGVICSKHIDGAIKQRFA